jgi:hypothetical protein
VRLAVREVPRMSNKSALSVDGNQIKFFR